jgi:hypothetical protein
VVRFANGDVKTALPSGAVVYFYHHARTTHTSYPSGLEVYEFPSGQVRGALGAGLRNACVWAPQITHVLRTWGGEEGFADGWW